MNKELPKVYEPQQVESRIYQMWEDHDCFKGVEDSKKKPFSIVMPPPNVTGQLHMGHALDCTLQDILTRFKRMQGYAALWVPGTDHAGIATQIKVEEELRVKEGKTRYDLGREKFLERVWKWKEEYGNRIVQQQKKMGVSCDWSRARFTMDEGCSKAVRETFCELYDKGLIYKGSRIINWCPHCVTALSDAEVEYVDKPGHLWYIRYPLADGSGDIVVATTRPETMMGDTGVAVNPEDENFKHLIGKKCILPIMNREIPIVGDEYCEIGFGTGAVKMTPAHDPNDFEVGLRHNLEVIRVIADDGHINENGGPYNGMDRYECRKAIVKDLEEQGYLVKVEPYNHNVGTCYRCHNDVEPLISAQWFVKMEPLAKEALRVVNEGEVKFVPEHFSKTYTNWMENCHDWCISRQLWWGHQIPAWTCEDCGHINVKREDPTACEKCGSTHLTREEDVLDTWFSSALWPFSTLGWPEQTADLNYWSAAARKGMYDVMCQYVDIVQELANVLTTRFNDGQISKTDLLQVQSRLKEAELNKSAAYKDYQIALQNLNVLMGVPPMTPVEIADAITTVQPLPMHIGEEAALQNRPDFTISRLNVEYQKRQINLSKAKYNPTLAIGFQGTWGTPMLNVKGSDQLWTPAVFASLKIPLFRWGARFKEVNSQKAILRSKEYVMDYTRDQISQEVANSWTSLTENTKQIDVAEEACKIAEENLDLNTFSYKEGKLPILDVLSAQLSWIQSYSSLIQTWYQQKASLAQYNKAVGIRRLQ